MKQEIILEYDAQTGKVTQKLGEVAKSQEQVKKGAADIGKQYGGLTNIADKFTGGLVSGMMDGVKATRSAVAGLQMFKTALISTGIGALIVAAGTLFAAFSRIQGVQDAFKAGSQALGVVLSRLSDTVAALGQWLIKAFTDPRQAIIDLWELIKTNIVNRFTGIVKQAEGLGRVLKAVFTLDFDELKAGLEDYGNALLQTATGVEDLIGKIVEGGKEMAEAAKAAYELAQAENALKDAQIALRVVTAEQNREIAQQRNIAADSTKSIAERTAALERALEIEDEQLRVSIRMAQEELRIQRERMALSNNMREDIAKEAELTAKLVELETESENARRRMISQLSSLRREEEARVQKAREDAIAAAKQMQADLATLEDYHFQQFATAQEKELRAVEVKYREMVALAKKNRQDTSQIDEAYRAQLRAINDKYDAIEAEQQRKKQEEEQKIRDAELAAEILAEQNKNTVLNEIRRFELDAQALALENEIAKEVEKWDKILAITEQGSAEYARIVAIQEQRVVEIKRKAIDKELKDRRDATMQVVAMNANALGVIGNSLAQLAEQSDKNNKALFDFGKALAIGSATVNTALAITDALAKDGVGPGTRFLAAAAAGAQGAAQVATIAKTKYKGGVPGVSTPQQGALPSPTTAQPQQAPLIDFGFLGSGAQEQAVQAFVISQQVTNQQQANQLLQDQSKL